MATVRLVEEQEASPEIKAIYDEIKQYYNLGSVPNVFKAIARKPETLKQAWEGFKQAEVIWGKETVQIIGLSTAIAMGSPYTIDMHTAILKQLGYDDEKLEALVDHITTHISGDTYAAGLRLEPDTLSSIMRKGMAA